MNQTFKPEISTLKKHPHLYNETISLIEKAFTYSPKHSFSTDFYPLIKKENNNNNHILIDPKTGRVIGHIGASLRILGNNRFNMPVALLGGIAIDEKFQGLADLDLLLSHVLSTYDKKVGLFLLWSNLSDLYTKYNFYQAGGIIQTGNRNLPGIVEGLQLVTLENLTEQEFKQIKEIYDNYTCKNYTTLLRGKIEWEDLKMIKSSNLYIKRNEQSDIVAYFFANKGHDLANIIHEIGYLPQYKSELSTQLSTYKLWLPESDKKSVKSGVEQIIYAALFRIGSLCLFNTFLKNYSNGELVIENINDNIINLLHKNSPYHFKIDEFLTYLFGPAPLKDFEDYGPPLNFFGLDSLDTTKKSII